MQQSQHFQVASDATQIWLHQVLQLTLNKVRSCYQEAVICSLFFSLSASFHFGYVGVPNVSLKINTYKNPSLLSNSRYQQKTSLWYLHNWLLPLIYAKFLAFSLDIVFGNMLNF